MAQQKAKYRGQRFNVVSKDKTHTILEGYGYSVRVLNDEVIYEEPVVDVLPATKPEDKLPEAAPEKPLTSQMPDGKDLIVQNETKSAELTKKAADEKVKLQQTELAAAKAKEQEMKTQVDMMKKTGQPIREESATDPLMTPENETNNGIFVTYSDSALQNNPLEKNRVRVGVIPKFGNRQYVPGRSTATVIWYDNKNNPEEIDIKMLKPLASTVAKSEISKQQLSEEIEWDKYKENDVDVNPETHAETQKTNDERIMKALPGLQASFRKMLEEIDQVLESEKSLAPVGIEDYAKDQINFDDDRVSDDVNYNDLENHYENIDAKEDTSFVQVDELDEEEDSYLVNNNASIMFDGTNYWYEMYEPAPEMNENTDVTPEPKERGPMCMSVREAYAGVLSKTASKDLEQLENVKGRDIEIGGKVFTVDPDFINGKVKMTGENGEMSVMNQIKLISLLKSGEAKILDAAMNECGTAAVAGPGAADGTVNQAVNATQGIATVPSRLGADIDRRKLEESIFTTDELKLKDTGYPKLDLSKLKK